MMFALLQEQHKTQMDAMVAANQKAMEALFDRMNAILGTQVRPVDKENKLPASGNTDNSNGGIKGNRKKCVNCRKLVFHKPTACYKLDANASKSWAGWKSVKDTVEALT
jgi:hypothetical protein